MASKYASLREYLEQKNTPRKRMRFQEIGALVGGLPPSAREHRAWWSNNANNTAARNGWLAAGFETANVDMENRELDFVRIGDRKPSLRDSNYQVRARRPESNEDRLLGIVEAAGGVDSLDAVVEAINKYMAGELVETELGRIIRKYWAQRRG